MRTNIDIDDDLMAKAMSAGPYQTKKDAVEAGLKLLARQAAYREILKWRGKLHWEGDESIDWTQPAAGDEPEQPRALFAAERQVRYEVEPLAAGVPSAAKSGATAKKAATPKRHVGR
jgi:antitoxin ParD1/3/4